MRSLAFRPVRRATSSAPPHTFQREGSSLIELLVAVTVLMVGLLTLSRSITASVDVADTNRETALATAAAQGMVEQLYAADFAQVFALYNDDVNDDPDGMGTAPGARFTVNGLTLRSDDADGMHGEIRFPADPAQPDVLREDIVLVNQGVAIDLDLDGFVDDLDHANNYLVLPALIRVEWQDGTGTRELELSTILGGH